MEGETSYYREDLPSGRLLDTLLLLAPPAKLGGANLTAQALPAAWQENAATLQAIVDALAAQHAYPVPWTIIQAAVDDALTMGLF